jgi:hypothetical protein
MIPDILELHMKLQRNRNEFTKYRLRTAQADDANKLLKSGWDAQTTAAALGIPVSVVEAELDRIYKRREATRKYFLK